MTSPLLAWGRVVRLSLFPSAAADVLAGAVVAAGAWPAGLAPWALVAGSLAVYHGGMALNDWADREIDRAVRPDRPIPSGALSARSVLVVAVLLLAAGPLLARLAGPGPAWVLAWVAAAAALYDLGPRGPLAGPLLLALCRAGNLGAGVALGLDARAASWRPEHLLLLAAYGGYVFAVSRLGRLEDRPPTEDLGRAPGRPLLAAAVLLFSAPLVVWAIGWGGEWSAGLAALVVATGGALPLARLGLAWPRWTPAEILPAMGLALRRLLVFTGSVALASGGLAGLGVFAFALAGYPLSWALRRVFPPS